MATVRDIATRALRTLGVLAWNETADANQAQLFLDVLNDWLDQAKADRPLICTVARLATAALTASQASFTVGPGANIPISPLPVYLDRVNYIDNSVSPALEIQLGDLLTDEEYAAIPVKSLTSTRPASAYYRPPAPGSTTGTLIPWPISTGASLLWAVYYAVAVDEFASINDAVALPPGYRRLLRTVLAIELAPFFGRQVSPVLQRQADNAMAVVARANERKRDLLFPAESLFGSVGGGWSIRTGQ